jgi:hypothetical protein
MQTAGEMFSAKLPVAAPGLEQSYKVKNIIELTEP